jgi:hypothetical protein
MYVSSHVRHRVPFKKNKRKLYSLSCRICPNWKYVVLLGPIGVIVSTHVEEGAWVVPSLCVSLLQRPPNISPAFLLSIVSIPQLPILPPIAYHGPHISLVPALAIRGRPVTQRGSPLCHNHNIDPRACSHPQALCCTGQDCQEEVGEHPELVWQLRWCCCRDRDNI